MQNLHQLAIELLDRVRNYSDSSGTEGLKQEIQRLIDEFEMQKNARSLEARVASIERMVAGLREDDMDFRHQDDLKDRCYDLKMGLRKFQ